MGDGATLQEIDTGANACSVEWCPIAGLESYVACSTYLLAAGEQDDVTNDTEQEGSSKPHVADTACTPVGTLSATGAASDEELSQQHAGAGQKRSGSIVIHKVRDA